MKVIFKYLVVFGCTFSFLGCRTKFPTTVINPGPATFTFDNFFTNCYKSANGTDQIDFDLVVTVSYYDAGAQKMIIYEEKTIASPATPNKRPIVVTMNVPKNIFFEVVANAIGKNCSRCASGWGGVTGNPTAQCPEVFIPGVGYSVALPRASAGRTIQTYGLSFTINNFLRMPNVVNSCGCTVPL